MQVPALKAQLAATLLYVDVLFGNEDEAVAFAAAEGWAAEGEAAAAAGGGGELSLIGIASRLSLLPKVTGHNRTVVLTNGCAYYPPPCRRPPAHPDATRWRTATPARPPTHNCESTNGCLLCSKAFAVLETARHHPAGRPVR